MLKSLRAILAIALLATPAAASHPNWIGPPKPSPQANAIPPAATAPYAGRPNYAHSVQPFHWGWFGAERYAPTVHRHSGYYDRGMAWSVRRW